jgi:DNA polymerase elongation subunit (family B)
MIVDWTTQKILDDACVLILDIETDSLDVETANAVVVGVRTNKSDKVHCIWKHDFDRLRKAIKKADFVVTFNGENFDIPVLMNPVNKLFKYESSILGKHIDLWKFVTENEGSFEANFGGTFTLDNVCKSLGFGNKDTEFDYSVLQKEYSDMTADEIEYVEKYTRQDIEDTWQLYELIEGMYSTLAQFLPKADVKKKRYITASSGALTYKIVCHMSGLTPLYANIEEGDTYKGGHVFEPIRELTVGNIKCVDYASAYPHAIMMGNLYTKCTNCTEGCPRKFTGGTTPDGCILNLQGTYCSAHGMGVKESVVQKIYLMRVDAKARIKQHYQGIMILPDEELNYLKKLQQGLKIVINTIYGDSGAPKFVHMYDPDSAADCTRIGRFNLKYLHKRLGEYGHETIYGDTDSAYILCPDGFTDDELQSQLDDILANLKSIFPFPQDTFKIDIEGSMKMIGFFKDGIDGYKKKRYVYVDVNDHLTVKGLSIVRRDCALLSKLVWDKHAMPRIIESLNHKILKSDIEMWISDFVDADITNASSEFKVKPIDMYSSATSIQARISKELGEGKHRLIKNRRGIGIGTGVSYATLEQAKDFTIRDIDLSRVYSDLSDVTDSGQIGFSAFEISK